MEINYKKNDNKDLFKKLNCDSLAEVNNLQNYYPLYNKYFTLNHTNFNSINLQNKFYLNDILEKKSYNKFNGIIVDNCGNKQDKEIFFKFSPLLDPVKYLLGKYENICDKFEKDDLSFNIENLTLMDHLYKLPKFQEINNDNNQEIKNNSLLKLNEENNTSYVDCFFSFLSSKLLNNYNFINGLNFYGSYLGIKNNFLFNIEDDIDILSESEFFLRSKELIYKMDKNCTEMFNIDTRSNKELLKLEDINESVNEIIIDNLNDLNLDELEIYENNYNPNEPLDITEIKNFDMDFSDLKQNKKEYDIKNNKGTNSRSSSTCSSRSSITNSENDDNDDLSISEEESCEEEDEVNISINKFPIQVIALESCNNTLDSYIMENKIKDKEWESIILQILFILATYQKTFKFTHNDLHTNNIVYNNTDKKFIYYKFEGTYYKLPTFGKIYKIIDFGRSIYYFKNNIHISDSFSFDGDAATQYNFEPYFNKNKPRIDPNFSFDLCRLSCSLFDYFVEDISDLKKIKSPIKKLIISWVYDDNNKNILYKSNGQERYPDFKLYKMIARIVNKHIPKDIIKNEIFKEYIISKKKINSGTIVNIDDIPEMYN